MIRPLVAAFGFLTRLPLKNGTVEHADLGRSLQWFPVVGAVIGLLLVVTETLARGQVSSSLSAVGLVVLLASLSGGLHLDGLADVFDALGGGRGDRERMLTIMRDSRIGAHGAAALILLLIAKVFAVTEVIEHGATWPLFAAPVVARWAVIPLVVFFPYARPEGLGRAFHDNGRPIHFIVATCFTLALLGWTGMGSVLPSLAALGVALLLGLWLKRHLGGLTGDVYGAAIEASELAFLVAVGMGAAPRA